MSDSATLERGEVSLGLRRIAGAGVLVVAGVAAAISYSHMRNLALDAGEGLWQATLLPLSVDGMMVVASTTAIARRRSGRSPGLWATSGFLLGVVASVAANIAAAQPSTVGRLVAAWPPLALLLAWEMAVDLTGAPHPAAAFNPRRAAGSETGLAGSVPARAGHRATGTGGTRTAAPITHRLDDGTPAQAGSPDGAGAGSAARPTGGTRLSADGARAPQRSAALADVEAAIAELAAENVPANRRSVTHRIRSWGLSLSNQRADTLLAEALHRRAGHEANDDG